MNSIIRYLLFWLTSIRMNQKFVLPYLTCMYKLLQWHAWTQVNYFSDVPDFAGWNSSLNFRITQKRKWNITKTAKIDMRKRITNWTSKILTKFDLDSLNASEEEWKLVRAFAQINLSLLIAYFSSMLSEIGHIILELGGCKGGH